MVFDHTVTRAIFRGLVQSSIQLETNTRSIMIGLTNAYTTKVSDEKRLKAMSFLTGREIMSMSSLARAQERLGKEAARADVHILNGYELDAIKQMLGIPLFRDMLVDLIQGQED